MHGRALPMRVSPLEQRRGRRCGPGGFGPSGKTKAATWISNIGYGPWQKAAWYHMILASGEKVARTIQPNSRMVLKFWPRLLIDNGLESETDDAIVGEEGRWEYVQWGPEPQHHEPGRSEGELVGVNAFPQGRRPVVACPRDAGVGSVVALLGQRLAGH